MTARFIAFEGGEGTGKSTQSARLAARLDAVLTREPGGTAVGERLRDLILDPSTGDIDGRTEVLLVAAARAQHVAEVIEPALAAGRHVVTDRFTGSSLAYQGYGRGVTLDDVRAVSSFATAGREPDLYLLLDVPGTVAAERTGGARDRLESAGEGFHERVRAGYAALAAADPTWVVIDGSASPDEVETAVWRAVSDRLGL